MPPRLFLLCYCILLASRLLLVFSTRCASISKSRKFHTLKRRHILRCSSVNSAKPSFALKTSEYRTTTVVRTNEFAAFQVCVGRTHAKARLHGAKGQTIKSFCLAIVLISGISAIAQAQYGGDPHSSYNDQMVRDRINLRRAAATRRSALQASAQQKNQSNSSKPRSSRSHSSKSSATFTPQRAL